MVITQLRSYHTEALKVLFTPVKSIINIINTNYILKTSFI